MKQLSIINKHSLPLIFVCLLAGAAGGYFLRGESASKADLTRLQQLEKEIVTLKTAAEQQKPLAVQSETKQANEVATALEPPVQTEEFKQQVKAQQERMKKALQDRKAMKVAERLSALKARLNLTDAQAENLKSILMENMHDDSNLMLANMDPEETHQGPEQELQKLLALMKGGNEKKLSSKVTALLNPEQQQAYAAFEAEQKANKVEIKANKELAKLQNSMSLSPEQKDKVFSIFSQLASAELENPISPIAPLAAMNAANSVREQPGFQQVMAEAERFKSAQQNRLAALKEILNPEQYQIYETQSQQGSMAELMEELMGDMPPGEAMMFK